MTRSFAFRLIPVFFPALGVLIFVLLHGLLYHDKIISHDDIALFETSRRFDPGYWLTTGYADFFAAPGYHFVRPVSNILMFLNHAAFGARYDLYFLHFFVILGTGGGLAAALGRALGLSVPAALGLGALVMLQPAAFGSPLNYLSFQQDVIAGVLCLGVALAVRTERSVLAACLLLVAVFTKETALFAPLVAALWALVFARRRVTALLLLAPLLFWVGFRLLTPATTGEEVYALPGGIGALAGSLLRGLALWPTGFASVGGIRDFVRAALAGDLQVLAGKLHVAGAILLNGALDLLIGLAGLRLLAGLLRTGIRRARQDPVLADDAFCFVWMLGGFAMMVFFTYDLRFAPVFHAFLLIFLFRLARGRQVPGAERMPRMLAGAAAVLLACFALSGLLLTARSVAVQAAEQEPRALGLLRDAVEGRPPVPGTRILVLPGPVTGANERWLMQHWGRPEMLVFAAQMNGCLKDATVPPVSATPEGSRLHLRILFPDCAGRLLRWGLPVDGIRDNRFGRVLPDGTAIGFFWPQGRVERGGLAGTAPDFLPGREMEITVDPADFARILVFDWAAGSYRDLAPGPGGLPEPVDP